MSLAAVISFMLFITSVYADTINVPGDQLTISDAVSVAVAGDTIKVASGTYIDTAQVFIDKDLTIKGAGVYRTTIKKDFDTGSGGDSRGWWLVDSGVILNLSRLTMDGSGYLTWQAIRHKGEGTIKHVKFTEIKYNESGPNYSGIAVAAFGTGQVDITQCKFNEIGRIGVLYFGSGVNGSNFAYNVYTGKGDGDWLDYGVEFGGGAQGTVKYSKISDNRGVASVDDSASAGILATTFFGPGTMVTINRNWLCKNTTGIAIGYDPNDENIDSTVVNVNKNKIYNNESNGVTLLSDGSTFERNWTWRNGDGFGVGSVASGNLFKKNKSFKNTEYGYNDESIDAGTGGTANTYNRNICFFNELGGSNPSGLCEPQP